MIILINHKKIPSTILKMSKSDFVFTFDFKAVKIEKRVTI